MAEDRNNDTDLAGLYRAAIRQHASAPNGYRQPISATHRYEEYNPLCGDRVEMQLQVSEQVIEAAAFDGEGCAICMASASMLCSLAPGQTVDGLLLMGEGLQQALETPAEPAAGAEPTAGAASPAPPDPTVRAALAVSPDPTVRAASAAMGLNERKEKSRLKPLLPEELQALLGVRPYPSRIRCATLPWTAAQRALSDPDPLAP